MTFERPITAHTGIRLTVIGERVALQLLQHDHVSYIRWLEQADVDWLADAAKRCWEDLDRKHIALETT